MFLMKRVFILALFFVSLFFVCANSEEKISVIVLEDEIDGYGALDFGVNLPEERINRRYESINGFSAEVTQKEYNSLKESGKRVFLSKIYHAKLNESISKINVSEAWRLRINSTNLTGSGQTVCVLDSGVNYNHVDLGGCFGENNKSSNCLIIGGYDYVNDDSNPLDDHGHGTHVTGIIASENSFYRGVAPGVKIIAVKVLGSDGNGNGADIIAGIDWCVNNASEFNISVISMSIGDCSNHSSYCPNNDVPMTNAINAAVAANISVVVSAGNGNRGDCVGLGITDTVGPSAPACVENATAVGATDISDSIFYQRGSLFQLMAPGVDIYSTKRTGGFEFRSGTSMAAPHVSGVIAIMQQLTKSQEDRHLTPYEIKDKLNGTGKIIYDSGGSGYNYSRIDSYSAILSMDLTGPEIKLVSPENKDINSSTNRTFVCNLTDWQLKNVTLNIWNSSGLYYNETREISGIKNSTEFNLTDIPDAEYTWNCEGYDSLNNYGVSSNNTLSVGGILVELISPSLVSYTNVNETIFTCKAYSGVEHQLSNVTFYLWNSSSLIFNLSKNVSGIENTTTFNYNLSEEGNYTWNCLAVNNISNSSRASINHTIIFDFTSPVISNALESSIETDSALISWSTNEKTNYSVSGGISKLNSSYSISHHFLISSLRASTKYTYKIKSCDRAGNCNESSENSFRTRDNSGSGSSRSDTPISEGGGVVERKKEYTATEGDMNYGYTREILVGERILFKVGKNRENHSIEIKNVSGKKVLLTISSEPVNLTLKIGKEAMLNLSSTEYYDLLIRLNGVYGGFVNLTIWEIKEEIFWGENKPKEKIYYAMDESHSTLTLFLVFLISVVVILAILFVAKKIKRKKSYRYYRKKWKKKKSFGSKRRRKTSADIFWSKLLALTLNRHS